MCICCPPTGYNVHDNSGGCDCFVFSTDIYNVGIGTNGDNGKDANYAHGTNESPLSRDIENLHAKVLRLESKRKFKRSRLKITTPIPINVFKLKKRFYLH